MRIQINIVGARGGRREPAVLEVSKVLIRGNERVWLQLRGELNRHDSSYAMLSFWLPAAEFLALVDNLGTFARAMNLGKAEMRSQIRE
jgi:hypothetical protein